MARVDGSEPRTCSECGQSSEEYSYLLNHSRVCTTKRVYSANEIEALKRQVEALKKFAWHLKECKIRDGGEGPDGIACSCGYDEVIEDTKRISEGSRPDKRICGECSGGGEIGLSDGEVPCPRCGGSGDPDKPGVFKNMA